MHLAFIPYGIKNMVDFIIEDLNHKYLPLRLYKEGEEDKFVLTQTQIRQFGIYELVFPKEYMVEVFSALKIKNSRINNFDKKILGISPLSALRKILELEPIPDFEETNHPNFPIPEYIKFVGIMPIGVRYDKDITEKTGDYEGWSHEGI
jgi:hypothetical protein